MKALITLLAFSLFCGALITDVFAEVYKQTNPDGSVTFSDVPSKIDAEPIKLPPSSTYSAPPINNSEISPKPVKIAVNYESMSITSPANDSAIRNNAGNLTIKFNAKPSLRPGHSYVLLMDGKSVGEGQAETIQLKNVDRGSHTFIAQVVDGNKETIIQSTAVVVHLQRAIAR
jgi:hypothetical protein